MNGALEQIKKILDNTKDPKYPEDVPHQYIDKFLLAEFICNASLASTMICLENLGLSPDDLKKLQCWASERTVTLRLKSTETCTFEKKVKRTIESGTSHVKEIVGNFAKYVTGRTVDKVVTTVTDYYWKFGVEYQLVVFQGTSTDDFTEFKSRSGISTIITSTETTPRPKVVIRDPVDLDLSWILSNIDSQSNVAFKINRESDTCKTPRRNEDIESAFDFFVRVHTFCSKVHNYFVNTVFPAETKDHGLHLSSINSNSAFVPVLPLFEAQNTQSQALVEDDVTSKFLVRVVPSPVDQDTSVTLPVGDLNAFLEEERRSLRGKFESLAKAFPDETSALITLKEASLLVVILHMKDIAEYLVDGLNYIEDMLRKQLIAAIGKVVTPEDFAKYMQFHNRRLFKEVYQPKPFSYAIRRPNHYPEGTINIEVDGSGVSEPIDTVVRTVKDESIMKFPINAATDISFSGTKYLHAFIRQSFSSETGSNLSLVARARQFSSFIVLVGRIASSSVFDPHHAIIVQNKDEITVPLSLTTIPTKKEFKDAISSLSPEQQRFAKAYRSLQLSNTLFGLCIIQIKPQMELLLKLPKDVLTKEIQLMQDLMGLFIEYQIPSDLLSYDGPGDVSGAAKLQAVKDHVSAIKDIIDSAKNSELAQAKQVQSWRKAESDYDESSECEGGYDECDDAYDEMEEICRLQEEMDLCTGEICEMLDFQGECVDGVAVEDNFEDVEVDGDCPEPCADIPAKPVSEIPKKAPSPEKSTKSEVKTKPDVETAGTKECDLTSLPTKLETAVHKLDEKSTLRPTIIDVEDIWSKKHQKSLLSKPETTLLSPEELTTEKNSAFDLLDALTRSGDLVVEGDLHVVLGSTQCFDKTLMNTVIQDNCNPIEVLERSSLIVASCIHDKCAMALVQSSEVERVSTYSPMLLKMSEEP